MNRAELEAMQPEQVKKIANDLGVKYHHKHAVPKIIDAIMGAIAGADPLSDEGDGVPEIAEMAAVQTFRPDAQPAETVRAYPTVAEAQAALATHIARGLVIVTMTEDYWHLRMKNREASGNMKMPIKQLVLQANILLQPTKAPTEE